MRFKLVGIGEILWDLLPGGRQIGGAPANFVYHACALGAEARVVSRVGDDRAGRELLQRLEELGVPTCCIEKDTLAPTGSVTVRVAADGQPQFVIHEKVAWDRISAEPLARAAVSGADAVCFGTLAQRSEVSRGTIQELVRSAPSRGLRILDVNLRQDYFSPEIINESLKLANVLKVNDAELPRLAEMFALRGDGRSQIRQLAERFELRLVACTRGELGSWLYSEGRWSDHAAPCSDIVDTVGAGDAFTAAMALGVLSGWDLDRVNQLANETAAYVCSCAGATPPLPPQVCEPFRAEQTALTKNLMP